MLGLELLMRRQQVDLVGLVVAAASGPTGRFADRVWNGGFANPERMKVIAAPGTPGEIEVVVVVPDALPAKR